MLHVSKKNVLTTGALTIAVGATSVALATSAFAAGGPKLKASPNKNLTNNKVVKVSGSKFTADAGETVYIVQCNANIVNNDSNACDENNVVPTTVDSKGKLATAKITVHTGTIGDGTCGTSSSDKSCYIVVSDATSTPGHTAFIPISFK